MLRGCTSATLRLPLPLRVKANVREFNGLTAQPFIICDHDQRLAFIATFTRRKAV